MEASDVSRAVGGTSQTVSGTYCAGHCLPAFLLMLLRRSSRVPDLLWGS
jgi:hypothetical protein